MASPKVKSLMQVIRKAGLTRHELRELEESVYQMQSEGGFSERVTQDLPPKMPEKVDDLNRAICLLGNRMMSDLKDKGRKEVVKLIGVYPTLEQAGAWKQLLTKQYRELTADSDQQNGSGAAAEKRTVEKKPARPEVSKTDKTKKRKLTVQERFERFNEEADFLDRIGLGHLAAKIDRANDDGG